MPRIRRVGVRLAWAVVAGAALAVVPKCPLCLVAYLSLIGAPLAGAVYPAAGIAAVAVIGLVAVRVVRGARGPRIIARDGGPPDPRPHAAA